MKLEPDFCCSSNADCTAYSEAACRAAALKLGLELGGAGYSFVDSHGTKGCYAYTSASDKYSGRAYYGTGGTDGQMAAVPK